jgi:broad specificity phosphatase PhoE
VVQWYCPDCFAEVEQRTERCPRCAADLTDGTFDFEEQLIRALRHPLPDRRLLAAEVLGRRRAHRAVPGLIAVVRESDDPYLVAEASVALARIGDPAGLAVVEEIAQHGPVVARAAARAALHEPSPTSVGAAARRRGTPMTTVFVIRHGRTALNAGGALRGRVDVPLDAVGLAEAARLGELFGSVPLTVVVSSPLRRARQTAEPVARSTGAPVRLEEAFTDRDVGRWSGMPAARVAKRFGGLDRAPGVEPRADFDRRVLAGWMALTAELAAQTFAVVTHDAVIACLLEHVLGQTVLTDRTVRPPTGSWNRLEQRDGGWSAVALGVSPDAAQPNPGQPNPGQP